MKRTTLIAFAAGSLATAGLTVLIAAGPEHKDHAKDMVKNGMDSMKDSANKAMDSATGHEMGEPDQANMMAEMMRLATPNEHHKELAQGVGSWSAHTSFTMDPSQPPVEGPAKMATESVLGGRYIFSKFNMEFMGQPFEGFSYMGYDVAHEQYISVWADSMSTKISLMTGNKDEDGNLVMTGISTTPMGDNPMKIVTSWQDDNHMTDKFYDQMPDGTWNQSGTITYTRD
jgi:hypothetical protein